MRAALLILVLVATGWAYWPSQTQPLIYEEARLIPDHQISSADLAHSLRSTVQLRPRALTTLTIWLNAYGSGTDPARFHTVNVLWHLLNGLLVAAIGVRLLGSWGGLVAGSLMLVHPLNSQAVTYLAARWDLVSTTGVLVALWASLTRRWWLVTLGLLCALAGKESAVVGLPLVLWVLWRTDRLRVSRWAFVAAIPVLAIGAYFVWMVLQFGEVFDPLLVSRGPLTFAGVQLLAVTRWLGLVVWPSGLSIDPDFEAWRGRWVIGAAIGWSLTLVLAWRLRVNRPWLLTALGWVLIAIGPRLLLPTSEFVAEHHSYLALVGVWFLIGAGYESVVCGTPGVAAGGDCDRGALAALGGRSRVVVV